MPNHIHGVMRPLKWEEYPLEKLLKTIKQRSSGEINKIVGTKGPLWQDESFDRMIRDEEGLFRIVQYIGNNPSKAGLHIEACPRWISPEWEKSGWKFDWV